MPRSRPNTSTICPPDSFGHRLTSPGTYASRRCKPTASRHGSPPSSSTNPHRPRNRPSTEHESSWSPRAVGPEQPVYLSRSHRQVGARRGPGFAGKVFTNPPTRSGARSAADTAKPRAAEEAMDIALAPRSFFYRAATDRWSAHGPGTRKPTVTSQGLSTYSPPSARRTSTRGRLRLSHESVVKVAAGGHGTELSGRPGSAAADGAPSSRSLGSHRSGPRPPASVPRRSRPVRSTHTMLSAHHGSPQAVGAQVPAACASRLYSLPSLPPASTNLQLTCGQQNRRSIPAVSTALD